MFLIHQVDQESALCIKNKTQKFNNFDFGCILIILIMLIMKHEI